MKNILVVDDDPLNLQIIADYLEQQSYQLYFANDGQEAWDTLQQATIEFDLIILDRMMPRMGGIELLQLVKNSVQFKNLPVIMQTIANDASEVAEGLAAGAWYYLSKPYRREALCSIVASALADREQHLALSRLTLEVADMLSMVHQANFRFRTPAQVQLLAATLSRACPASTPVAMGLSELMLNAVEHGNLEISYRDKSCLLETGNWQNEIERRLSLPEYVTRYSEIHMLRKNGALQFIIRDHGKGFNWQKYLDFDAERAFDSHGRGIAMARQLAFDTLEYLGCGNEVCVTVSLISEAA